MMTTLNELIEQGKKEGYLEYSKLAQVLKDDNDLIPDQIEDIVGLLTF